MNSMITVLYFFKFIFEPLNIGVPNPGIYRVLNPFLVFSDLRGINPEKFVKKINSVYYELISVTWA